MASMVPYRSVFGVRPSASSLFDLFDDMTDLANSSIASKAFPLTLRTRAMATRSRRILPVLPRMTSTSSSMRVACRSV